MIDSLQSLNPDTHLIAIDSNMLAEWPATPTLFIESPLSKLIYFGPIGFGAFCSQDNTRIIDGQLEKLKGNQPRPFFNVIGSGCFCPWK